MGKIIKFLGIIFLAAVIFPIASCVQDANDNKDESGSESPYLGNTLEIKGQQVWTRNHNATKVSQAYIPHKETHTVYAIVYAPNPATNYQRQLAVGRINSGVFNLTLQGGVENDKLLIWDDPDDCGYALGCDYDKCDYWRCFNRSCEFHQCSGNHEYYIFRSFFKEWIDTKINPSGTLGNVAILMSKSSEGSGALDRQGMIGTGTTITCETILYVYVNQDCQITGKYGAGYVPGNYYYSTEGSLNLTLKKGWNLVSRRETYGTNFNGHAKIGMMIRNPISNPESYKWTIEQGFTF